MVPKLLSVVGALALVGIGAAGIGSLMLVKDRIRVVVQPDAVVETDSTALLRDDVRALRDDVSALSQALGDNLGRLVEALETSATQRHGELVGRFAGVDDLRRGTATAVARLQQIEQRLDGLAQSFAGTPATGKQQAQDAPPPAAAEPVPAEPVAAEPVAAESVLEPVVDPAEESGGDPAAAAPTPVATAGAQAPKAGKGFLSFQLPSRSLAFDREQDFEVVAELSRVGFDAKSTLHDFSGVTQRVEGTLHANLADPNGAWSGAVECDAATLVTGVDGRDEAMREHLDTEHHKAIRYEIERFAPDEGGIDAAARTVRGTVHGTMHIRGVEQPLAMAVTLHFDEGKRLCVDGSATVALPDYQVPVPSKLGLINMEEQVKIWIALRARVRTGGSHGK
ncbi:MAG: YceI family protein [Planctomycetota bacterium]